MLKKKYPLFYGFHKMMFEVDINIVTEIRTFCWRTNKHINFEISFVGLFNRCGICIIDAGFTG